MTMTTTTTTTTTTTERPLPRDVVAVDPLRCERCNEFIPPGHDATLIALHPVRRFEHPGRCPRYTLTVVDGGEPTQPALPGLGR